MILIHEFFGWKKIGREEFEKLFFEEYDKIALDLGCRRKTNFNTVVILTNKKNHFKYWKNE